MVILLTNSDFYFGSSPPGVTGFWPDSYGYGWNQTNLIFRFQSWFIDDQPLQLYMLDSSSGITMSLIMCISPVRRPAGFERDN